mmetsp:Transcript_2612/g.3990  ORF Transcript_2612/g.3990 Transcript_2612/m.3990 type:complete len:212 (+) Transcript_2612:503-1138(+)
MLDKQERHLEKQMEEAKRTALQKSRKGNKKAAMFQLKRKKMFEKRLNQLYGQRENVERLINAMEVVAFNKQNIERLKAGKIALEQTIKEVDVDNVEEMMEDIKESVDMADEIGEAMSRSLGNEEYDEEDLEKELEDLQNEEMEAEMLQAPEVPVDSKVSNKKEEVVTKDKSVDVLSELASAPAVPSGAPKPQKQTEKKDAQLESITAGLGL